MNNFDEIAQLLEVLAGELTKGDPVKPPYDTTTQQEAYESLLAAFAALDRELEKNVLYDDVTFDAQDLWDDVRQAVDSAGFRLRKALRNELPNVNIL